MTARRVLVVGAGERVRQDVLPALARVPELLAVERVVARTRRALELAGRPIVVEPLADLTREQLAACDLAYVAVGKGAVPAVLERLVALGGQHLELILETPVLRLDHLRHARHLPAFRGAWVAEDCTRLPWLDTVRAAVGAGLLGAPEEVVFDRAAYRYHALATMKTLLGARRIARARAARAGGRRTRVEVRLDNGTRGILVEPRDYAAGHLVVRGGGRVLSDAPEQLAGEDARAAVRLELVVRGGRCTGLRAGDVETHLDDGEQQLVGPVAPGERVTAHTAGLKRAGLLRLLRDVHAGRGGYPWLQGLEDMAADALLEKVGRYPLPLLDVRSGPGRTLLATAARLIARS